MKGLLFMTDTKTIQSLKNYKKALDSLKEAVQKPKLSDLELAGAIQNFEFSYELSWKTVQKYAASQGRKIVSPREAFQFALESGYIRNEKLWLSMIEDRNETVHTYDRASAERVFKEIKGRYFDALSDLFESLSKISS